MGFVKWQSFFKFSGYFGQKGSKKSGNSVDVLPFSHFILLPVPPHMAKREKRESLSIFANAKRTFFARGGEGGPNVRISHFPILRLRNEIHMFGVGGQHPSPPPSFLGSQMDRKHNISF
jgi:hypothetical protein